jgi:nucleoporin POM152
MSCLVFPQNRDLSLGRPPFQLVYNIVEATSHGAKLSYNPTYYSTLAHSQLQLQTSHVGRVFYEISQVGDAAYPLAKYKSRTIPRHERILFEQQIFVHPSAGFKTQGRLSYFLHDAFVASASPSSDGIVILEGAPPFRLHLTIKHMSTRQVDSLSVDVPHHTWKVDIPSYTFKTIGPHLISIESVSDVSNCAHVVALKSPSRSIFVDVSAGAAIVPYDQREHFCVGETASFHLEGIAPWIIGSVSVIRPLILFNHLL